MHAIDIFSLAAAVVTALLVQIVQPFSRQWWAGMALASAIAVAALGHVVWNKLPEQTRNQLSLTPAARLSVVAIEIFPAANNEKAKFKYTLANVGLTAADYIWTSIAYEISPDMLTPEDEDMLADMAMFTVPPATEAPGTEFQPGEGAELWHELNLLVPQSYREVRAGKQFLYIMFKIVYRDDATPEGKRRLTEMCRFFSGSLSDRKFCAGHNRTYLVD